VEDCWVAHDSVVRSIIGKLYFQGDMRPIVVDMKHTKPRVSIGIPVFNGEDYLAIAINSCLEQTFTQFEIVISDNASTDGTERICREYAARDNRIRYFRANVNKGAAWNFRRVFELARGDFFMWACYDDLFAKEYVERCLKILETQPSVVLCYSRTVLIDGNGQRINLYRDKFALNSAKPSARFCEIVEKLELCNVLYGLMRSRVLALTPVHGNYVASDIPLLAELALHGQFYEIPEYLFYRRIHPKGSAQANPTLTELALHYDPSRKLKPVLRTWRHFFEYLRAIGRVRMPGGEKIRCLSHMMKWFSWRRISLVEELATWTKWFMKTHTPIKLNKGFFEAE
jgi:glycosyltransferase involved in cell wall biosynthesis